MLGQLSYFGESFFSFGGRLAELIEENNEENYGYDNGKGDDEEQKLV